MNVVKEYMDEKTKIRIHKDYVDTNEQKEAKEIIISIMINFLRNEYNN